MTNETDGTDSTGMPAGGLVGGRYRVDGVVGSGATSRVYRAVDTRLGRTVAVKVFRAGTGTVAARRLAEEGRLLASLRHPGLVSVYDAGSDEGQPYVVMTLVEGESLREQLTRGPVDPASCARLGAALADVLAHVHGAGIVHRDVKPSNVLLDRAGRPHLTDFGISRLLDSTRLTTTGMVVGTAAYMAPEQVRGDAVGPSADVYALGLVLLEAVTGEVEYPGTMLETAVARLTRSPRVPEDVPLPLRDVLVAMTAGAAGDRPTAAQCRDLLLAPAAGTVAAGPTGPVAAGTVGVGTATSGTATSGTATSAGPRAASASGPATTGARAATVAAAGTGTAGAAAVGTAATMAPAATAPAGTTVGTTPGTDAEAQTAAAPALTEAAVARTAPSDIRTGASVAAPGRHRAGPRHGRVTAVAAAGVAAVVGIGLAVNGSDGSAPVTPDRPSAGAVSRSPAVGSGAGGGAAGQGAGDRAATTVRTGIEPASETAQSPARATTTAPAAPTTAPAAEPTTTPARKAGAGGTKGSKGSKGGNGGGGDRGRGKDGNGKP